MASGVRLATAKVDNYSRSALLPAGKNGKKPKKIIGTDGKLVEPEDPCTATTRDIVNGIMDGKPASDNLEAALQKIFSILAVLPSVRLGLIEADSLTLSGDGTAVEHIFLLLFTEFPRLHNDFLIIRLNVMGRCIL